MRTITPGRLLFEQIVSPQFMEGVDDSPLDAGKIKNILQAVAEKDPDKYRDISFALQKLGAKASIEVPASFSLNDLSSPIDKKKLVAEVEAKENEIRSRKDLTPKQRSIELVKLYGQHSASMPDKVYEAANARGSNLARMVAAGARGNKSQLNSNIGADWLMLDANSNPIPVPIKNSYAEGLSPAEYYAAAYGTRRGLLSTKFSVQEAGYLSKQLSAATHDLIVSSKDCETNRGFPTTPEDKDNIGAVMAKDAGGFPAGTVITSRVLKQLRDNKVERMTVRSPLTCAAKNGICSICAGIKEHNRFPKIGERVGLASSSSVGEPLSQGTLCLDEDTLVRMADWTIRRIKDIAVGDWVLGADKNGRTFPVRVVNVFDRGTQECFETKFKTGVKTSISLVSTLGHKILCKWYKSMCEGEKLNHQLQVLPVGTKCRFFSAIRAEGFDDSSLKLIDEPWALFVGIILGDGCCVESVNGVHLSCADDKQIQALEPYLRAFNLKLTKLKGHDCYWRFSQIDEAETPQDDVSGRFAGSFRNPAQIAVRRFGVHDKYAHEKVIPDEVLSWSNKSVADLLAGLFVTDGSVYLRKQKKRNPFVGFSFTSVSEKLVRQVQDLLQWRFGIYSTFHVTPPSKKKKRGSFDIKIATNDSSRKFYEMIPMIGIKTVKMEEWKHLLDSTRDLRWKRASRQSAVSRGRRPTMDIEVDHPDHLFVLANGMCVSNSEKHSGGVASSSGKAVSAFKSIDSLVQVPDVFPNGATVADSDGIVSKIEEAPQGGHYVHIGDKPHYVGRDQDVKVKRGETVEAGDTLSSGVPNPYDIVKHKGIGAGRVYFVNAFRDAMSRNNISNDRRHLEVIGRALVNHVKVTDPEGYGSHLPDDIVEYSSVEDDMAKGNISKFAPQKAIGRFLAKPTLHYSVGTRITPSVAKTFADNNENEIEAMDESPGFEPEMQRVMDIPGYKPDWMAQFAGSNLKKRMLNNVHSGDAVSDPEGTSFIPGLARGVGFGDLNHVPKP